jgi:WD40 repeat protein
MHPGSQPLVELELALLSITADRQVNFREKISRDRHGLGDTVQSALPDENNQLLLVIDQFEELFSLVEDEDQRIFFLDILSSALNDPQGRMRVVITLRADFYDRPLLHPEFGRLVEERTVVVLPLSAEELEAVIRKPAERAGAILEEGLVQAITTDVADQPGGLPLLQYALTELFERREGRMLSCEAYHALGGVLGALGRRAEEVYVSLDRAEQTAARQLFLRLVTLGEGAEDTRRRVLNSEVTGIHPQTMPQVIDTFGKVRLLTFDRDPETREPTVEVAHEALLQEWQRLRGWLDNSRADIRMQRVLANAALEWQGIDRDPGYLLRDTRLDQFEAWAATTDLALTDLETDFLDASLAERRARLAEEEQRQAREAAIERRSHNFLRGLVAVLAVATIGAVILTLYAFNQRGQAQSSAATAQAEAAARATQQMVAESEADQRATQQAVAEEEARARATAEAIAVEERDKVLRQASVALADQAREMKDFGDPELAVLLALAALSEYPYTSQAEQALADSVLEVPTSKLVPADRNSRWLAVAWSPTADLVATALFGEYKEPYILIQDPHTESDILSIPLGVDCYGASNVAWSPSGDRLIAVPQFCDYAPRVFDAVSGELIATLTSRPEQANFVADWAPDGKAILTGSLDGYARTWDAQSGEKLLEIPAHGNYITRVAWSPTGNLFATGSDDDTAKVWIAETGELLFTHRLEDDVAGLDWSPDGNYIVVAGLDASTTVLDGQTGETMLPLVGHTDQVWDAAWSPDGAVIATDSRDGHTRLWDAFTGRKLDEFQNNLEEQMVLSSIDWSPDGNQVLIMGVEFNQVWDLSTKSPTILGHSRGLTVGKWSPDGRLLATGSLDSTVRIWEAADNTLTAILEHPAAISDLAWAPDGRQLATAVQDGDIRVWDTDSQSFNEVPNPEGFTFTDLVWSPDENRIAASSEADLASVIWDVDTGESLLLEQGDLRCFLASPSWSPDGRQVVTGCIGSADSPARIWDAATGEEIQRLESMDGASQLVAWSPDGRSIAVGYSDPIVRIWDADSMQPITRFTRHADRLVDLDFSPNSQRLVSVDIGRQVLVWDVSSGSVVHTWRSTNTPASAAWSPSGKQVIITSIESEPDLNQAWQSSAELIAYAEQCCVRRQLGVDERRRFGLP